MAAWDPQQEREAIDRRIFALPARVEAVETVQDRMVGSGEGGVPVRIYWPDGSKRLPGLLYIHGAGWVAGSLDTHDPLCRSLARRAGCCVVSVGYRLAPEHPFPAALEDCWQALTWCTQNTADLRLDPARLAAGGDSAGGNLAAALCLLARDRAGGPLIGFQLLVNPALDLTRYTGEDFAQMRWFVEQYLPAHEQRNQPLASPLLANSLAGLPPAFILTGELDNLRPEGEEYGQRLRGSGVPAEVYCQRGAGHLAGQFARATPEAEEALSLCAGALQTAFGRLPLRSEG